MKKIVLLAFVLVFLSTAVVVGSVRPTVAEKTIYIRSDGSVEGTGKIQRDGNVYTFTDNIYDEIVVERDNIVVDGAGCTLQGTGAVYSKGIDLSDRSNVTIKNMEIKAFAFGIYLEESSNNSISRNNITNNHHGIWLGWSSNNTVFGNTITNSNFWGIMLEYDSTYNSISRNTLTNNNNGIWLFHSSNNNVVYGNNVANKYDGIWLNMSSSNSISGNSITDSRYGIRLEYSSSSNSISVNNITNNYYGIWLEESSYNKIYHNNFINNTVQVIFAGSEPSINTWDAGYPLGGNYWSAYTGVDANGDGIGDTPYIFDIHNRDRHPLMNICGEWTLTFISISTSSPSTLQGFAVNITGTLYDSYGNSLDDKTVVLYYTFSGNNTWVPITSDTTDHIGHYSVKWIPPATGYFIIKAEWAGNTTHFTASNSITLSTLPYEDRYVFSVESNSTISALAFNTTSQELSFTASGPSGTRGYVKLTIAKGLVVDIINIRVYLDGDQTEYSITSMNDSWLLTFDYIHSAHQIVIKLNPNRIPTTTFLGLDWWLWVIIIVVVAGALSAAALILRRRKPPTPTATPEGTLQNINLLTVAITIIKRRLLKTSIH